MKYMGSKRAMLQNGLGKLLDRYVPRRNRFVDLFAGTGSVSSHVAVKNAIPVIACDLQKYSEVLTAAVICRTRAVNWRDCWRAWLRRARQETRSLRIPATTKLTREVVIGTRNWCSEQVDRPITRAYGGHYFSPEQAIWIDALRKCLPRDEPIRTVALAALIRAASMCVASPGHTAQPFQPTRTAKPFLELAWTKDVAARTAFMFEQVAAQFAKCKGKAMVGDANEVARRLHEGDLVFIDPPYSGVHYSRFYHVLESIAFGKCGEVSGIGRYPGLESRPYSKYSVSTESEDALDCLLSSVAGNGSHVIFTFPDHKCSNGLSGNTVRDLVAEHFHIKEQQVTSRFSTLGGSLVGRAARKKAQELVLVLKPK